MRAPVAQWTEYLASNQGVASSTLAGRTKNTNPPQPSLKGGRKKL